MREEKESEGEEALSSALTPHETPRGYITSLPANITENNGGKTASVIYFN